MSKVSLITFATPNFYYSRATLIRSARKVGIENIKAYKSPEFIKTDFYSRNAVITTQPRGAGYWLWKPYYILEGLKSLNEGDILVYCDSGVDIIASLQPLIDIVSASKKGILLFENYQASAYFPKSENLEINEYNLYTELNKNKYWAKRDAFVLMGLDEERYWNSPQVDANFQVYRKCEASMQFVEEWLNYCCNPQIITDTPNTSGLPNFPNMFNHIHDQAIISLLAEKHEIELHRCASQFGNHYKAESFRKKGEFALLPYSKKPKENSMYGTLLNHHRTKFMPFGFRLKSYIKQEVVIFKSHFI